MQPQDPQPHELPRRPIRLWLPPLLVFSGIFALSSIPGHAGPWLLFPDEDKLAHFCIFGVLGLTLIRAIWRTTDWTPAVCVTATVVAVISAGIADEAHQHFVPGRGVEWADVVADALGGLVAALIWVVWSAKGARRIR